MLGFLGGIAMAIGVAGIFLGQFILIGIAVFIVIILLYLNSKDKNEKHLKSESAVDAYIITIVILFIIMFIYFLNLYS